MIEHAIVFATSDVKDGRMWRSARRLTLCEINIVTKSQISAADLLWCMCQVKQR